MKLNCSGAILSGGQNRRFSGQNKSFLTIGDKRIIDRMMECFSKLFDEIILVTNDPTAYLEWDVNIVTDIYPIRCSLTGIHAGLIYSTNPFTFFSACDTPFLSADIVQTVIAAIDSNKDVIIPHTHEGYEPLCAAYSKSCVKSIEDHLNRQNLKIQGFFNTVRVKEISETQLRSKDPRLLSFFNVNTPEDLIHANSVFAAKQS